MNKYLNWTQAIAECQTQHIPWVLVTVIEAYGSTPREQGCKMVVSSKLTYDTIGGGQLEFAITARARELIAEGVNQQVVEDFPLSARAGQCCGGRVKVLLECFVQHQQHLHLFGAGHVAQSLIPILAQMNLHIHWVDSREQMRDAQATGAEFASVQTYQYTSMVEHISQMQADAMAIILTHEHSLDYQLVEALLDRKDCHYIGMIGSEIKARRFRQRLKEASFSSQEIAQLISPIGLLDVPGKKPIEVAVSIAAQVIQQLHTKEHQLAGTNNSGQQNNGEEHDARDIHTQMATQELT